MFGVTFLSAKSFCAASMICQCAGVSSTCCAAAIASPSGRVHAAGGAEARVGGDALGLEARDVAPEGVERLGHGGAGLERPDEGAGALVQAVARGSRAVVHAPTLRLGRAIFERFRRAPRRQKPLRARPNATLR